MGTYRNKFDIIADILRVVKDNGAKKTQIMYGANLSYTVLTRYLNLVLDACLIKFESDKRCYVRARVMCSRLRVEIFCSVTASIPCEIDICSVS